METLKKLRTPHRPQNLKTPNSLDFRVFTLYRFYDFYCLHLINPVDLNFIGFNIFKLSKFLAMEFNISLVLLDLEKSIKENLKEVLLNFKKQ
ncbi:hypothetical protein QW060_10665 [Myroides ceti]|uniref:Uncharacterized protein n=1 Tax=Paenimyroides ceti TaxID=395087 RepID=A0ABT8CTM7_9FLAO|nr:hypothetical protein [Paenimyroides ceti]MDN3707595.1 hypothetical protein [Paenimyroides ceti]